METTVILNLPKIGKVPVLVVFAVYQAADKF